MSEQSADCVFKTAYRVPVGRWALDPCYRCGRQPEKDEVIQLDWMAQTVTCGVCHRDDQRAFARALDASLQRHIDGDGCAR